MARHIIDPWKSVADCFVVAALIRCTLTPVIAIFRGDLYGPGAFLAGAIVVSTIVFGEAYFRDEDL